jgi:hypothetical protein
MKKLFLAPAGVLRFVLRSPNSSRRGEDYGRIPQDAIAHPDSVHKTHSTSTATPVSFEDH